MSAKFLNWKNILMLGSVTEPNGCRAGSEAELRPRGFPKGKFMSSGCAGWRSCLATAILEQAHFSIAIPGAITLYKDYVL